MFPIHLERIKIVRSLVKLVFCKLTKGTVDVPVDVPNLQKQLRSVLVTSIVCRTPSLKSSTKSAIKRCFGESALPS